MNFEDVFDQKIGSLKFFYLYKYYPYDEINDQTLAKTDISNRYLIWDFKNSPDKERKPEDVLRVRNIIIERLYQSLSKIDKDWSTVVLLCLPASTQEAYEARYKEFSDMLCNKIGLINGYEYIHYIEDGIPKHEGGDGKPIYGIDYEKPEERMLILKMMEAAMTKGESWETLNEMVDRMMQDMAVVSVSEEELKEQIEKTAKVFAMDMLLLKFVQGLPIVGVIGGAGNPVYYQKVMKYVQLKYRKRYLWMHM